MSMKGEGRKNRRQKRKEGQMNEREDNNDLKDA
jgi:hypothetical protein